MSVPRKKPDIYGEILANMPTTHPWERWVLMLLAKKQSETNKPVTMTPQELVRTGFDAKKASWTLQQLLEHGCIYEARTGGYLVRYPPRKARWRQEQI